MLGTSSLSITFLKKYISKKFLTSLLLLYKTISDINNAIKTKIIIIFNIFVLFNLFFGLSVFFLPNKAVEHIIFHNYTFSYV